MSAVIRPEVVRSNRYWISKERYYELKHFCLQYPEWKAEILRLEGGFVPSTSRIVMTDATTKTHDITGDIAMKAFELRHRVELVEETVNRTAPEWMREYLLAAVTQGISYTNLKVARDIPCGKDYFYDMYRKFYWTLDKVRS